MNLTRFFRRLETAGRGREMTTTQSIPLFFFLFFTALFVWIGVVSLRAPTGTPNNSGAPGAGQADGDHAARKRAFDDEMSDEMSYGGDYRRTMNAHSPVMFNAPDPLSKDWPFDS